ncbi:internal scaffolding protein [Blackfly microvirus SF02]|uniref:Internal scaffolding protein n=1 Tax=Blackfly microvirus SF02 TaxID=2576452 RepID=A0A4P8PSF2_9VIRU|nr:internal scaffolding protein [Blackfly microvirus SF02]
MLRQGMNSDGEYIRDFYVERDCSFGTEVFDDGVTRQEFKDECDINVLMASYERTGVITHVNAAPPQFLDVTDVPDLARAIAIMHDAETAFMTLPASARKEFDNDPVKFMDFAGNPENLKRMREWGLAAPEKLPDAALRVEVVDPPAGASTSPAPSGARSEP